MVHKIKGWARDFVDHGTGYELGNGGGWAEFSEDGKEEFGDVPCTLVTTHERVFTESEVRAMMDDVKAIATEHSQKCYTNHIEQMTPPAPVAFHIDNYLWKSHGFSSDPA